jgi:hypothetical protein
MMAAECHVTSSSGLRKFQADGFLSDRVYHVSWFCSTSFSAQNHTENKYEYLNKNI